MTFSEVRYVPIPRLETGPFTEKEWQVILQHADADKNPPDQTIQAEHLSRTRLRESLVVGLE